ncbi:hypothetical protein [Xanthobacter sediminis]|uniref:hypothetical protein n=1 Tax=Xanthobacter sediminis TaxID=3119926 RepID=UPI003729EEC8
MTIAVAFTLGLASAAAAQGAKVFGQGFDNWVFTQTPEADGLINCRATRKAGGREDIVAMRTSGQPYVSVSAAGRKGKYRESIIESAGSSWTVTAEANGVRLWFTPLSANAVEEIMLRGSYAFFLGGTEDREKVNLGAKSAAAWARVKECVAASRR